MSSKRAARRAWYLGRSRKHLGGTTSGGVRRVMQAGRTRQTVRPCKQVPIMNPIFLDHCVIHVSNWERSNRFYRDVLGAEIVSIGKGFSYRFGASQLNCHGPGVQGTPKAA